ncbi:MAG: D-Ala-D-Ala carboxypeptidase family metallohydrolase [Candidatus Atribacteria bacterium]|nr:D-Ala-D-Ala carboxypeptidase family metallohydrolase [Candidatus Atribacteria bacterium]
MKLSKNFEDKEFFCPCKNCKKDKFPDPKLLILLQELRDEIKKPIYITTGGGIRCKTYNKLIGGYVDSPHLKCKAADIRTDNFDYVKLAKIAKEVGFSRIGLYPFSNSKFIHVDIIEPYPNQSWVRDKNGRYFYYKTLELALRGLEVSNINVDTL